MYQTRTKLTTIINNIQCKQTIKMLKVFVLVALLSFAAARPSILSPAIIPAPAVVRVISPIAPAVSHQSITQVHGAPVITSVIPAALPIVSSPLIHGPVVVGPHPVVVG